MKKWLFRIVWIPVFVLTAAFLIANRQLVSISLDPFNADNPAVTTAALPLWMWLIFMLSVGFAIGALGMWVSGRDGRIEARANRRVLKSQTKEITELKTRLAATERDNAGGSVPSVADEAPLLESEPTA